MSQEITVELIDDIDGKKADETVSFGIDGVAYEIDLTAKNAAALRKTFENYIAAGRRTGGSRARGAGKTNRVARRDPELTKAIREWAKASGYQLSERGRISTKILQAYNNAPNL